jgi:pimeloyl-ACP methyl ester carboxylesterase
MKANQCVIFIHGFANTRGAAAAKYSKMMRTLRELTCGENWRGQSIAYFGFHWPGNHWLPVVNQLTFASRVSTASNAGGNLARWLQGAAPAGHVTLVAHSLGCRVALACIKELLQAPADPAVGTYRLSIPSVVLMAGAVRRQECAVDSEVYGQSYPNARYVNLYSYYDAVLASGFAAGQLIVDGPGRAIGRWGEPKTGRWQERVSTNLGHGKYWASEMVGQSIATTMGLAISQPLNAAITPASENPEAELPVHAIDSVPSLGS